MHNFTWRSLGLEGKFRPGSILGTLIAVAALITISQRLASMEITWLIETLLKGYQTVITLIFGSLIDWWFPALVKTISSFVGWNVELFPQWRDLVALLTLYLSSHVKEALAENVPRSALAISMRSIAAIIGLLLAVAGGSITYATGFSPLVSIFTACLIGIATYRLGFAAQFAFDRRRDGFRIHFRNKASGAMTIVLGGVAIIFAWILTMRFGPSDIVPGLQVMFLFIFVLFLSSYHVVLAVYSEWRKSARLDVEARKRISATGHYNIGIRILWAWAGAGITVLLEGVT